MAWLAWDYFGHRTQAALVGRGQAEHLGGRWLNLARASAGWHVGMTFIHLKFASGAEPFAVGKQRLPENICSVRNGIMPGPPSRGKRCGNHGGGKKSQPRRRGNLSPSFAGQASSASRTGSSPAHAPSAESGNRETSRRSRHQRLKDISYNSVSRHRHCIASSSTRALPISEGSWPTMKV